MAFPPAVRSVGVCRAIRLLLLAGIVTLVAVSAADQVAVDSVPEVAVEAANPTTDASAPEAEPSQLIESDAPLTHTHTAAENARFGKKYLMSGALLAAVIMTVLVLGKVSRRTAPHT